MQTNSPVSRRSFVIGTGLTAATVILAHSPHSLAADPGEPDEGIVARMRKQAATARITTQSLRGGVSVLAGAGGNIAVLDGPDGKVIVDSGISTARSQLEAALAAIGPAPITRLINTHWHFDHTDGNEWLHAAGALIVAAENCRARLAVATRVEAWDFTFPRSPTGALPEVTFKESLTVHSNRSTLSLEALSPAHTDSDTLVEFREADVMHVGDIWWNGHYPFIDYSTGGSIDGVIRAVETCLARATDSAIIIPGHGPTGDKAQLTEFRDMLTTVRQRVAAMKKRGSTLEDIIDGKPTNEFDARYGGFLIAPSVFTSLVYAGV